MSKLIRRYQALLVTLSAIIFILTGTLVAIQFAKGYRFSLNKQTFLEGTGLLAANSSPQGAKIYINGEVSSQVTNDTISLKPGSYDIKISKDGYTSWQKTLLLEREVVTSTNAMIFKAVPSLTPLTFSGATNLTPSPNGQQLAFTVASASAELEQGLYLIDLTDNPLSFSRGPRQIAQDPNFLNFKDSNLLWSPDSSQILASFPTANYLIDTDRLTRTPQLQEASSQLSFILNSWENEIVCREKQLLLTLPEEMQLVATSSAKNLYFSPDGNRLLYTATQSHTIPENLVPALPGSSTQTQTRTIEPGNTYVYDLKEDKNFLLFRQPAELFNPELAEGPPDTFTKINLVTDFSQASIFSTQTASSSATPKLQDPSNLSNTINNFKAQYTSFYFTQYQWFPTSNHILVNSNGSIDIVDYDSTNYLTLYAGSYEQEFVYPSPNGSQLIILGNLTGKSNLPANLYSINLK